MRYFSYNEYINDRNIVITCSEEEIRKCYYPIWHSKMIKKYGEEVVNKNYSFEDCIEDWKTTNWAWE
jgi:hypothetical protein